MKLYFYGLVIFSGVILGFRLVEKKASSYQFSSSEIEQIFVGLIPSAIIGARLYHVLSWLTYYRMFPHEIFYFWQGGLGIYGALVGGFIFLLLYSKWEKINFWRLIDLLSAPTLLCQAVGRLGNYFNDEVFGPPTSLPWKVFITPDKRPLQFLQESYFHPIFLYEALLLLLAFIFLSKKEPNLRNETGALAGLYFVSYGLIRFLTEFLRFETWRIANLKVAQIISVFFILFGLYLYERGIRSQKLIKSNRKI